MSIGYEYGKRNLEKVAFPVIAPLLRFGGRISGGLVKRLTGGMSLGDVGKNLYSGTAKAIEGVQRAGSDFRYFRGKIPFKLNSKFTRSTLKSIPTTMTPHQRQAFKTVAKGVGVGTGMYLGNKAYNASMGEAKQREQEYSRIAREQALDRQRMNQNQQMSQGM